MKEVMGDKWEMVVISLLNEEQRLKEQTEVYMKTRYVTMKEMSNELSIIKIAKLFGISRQRVYKILEGQNA
tara:strand:- start:430 stop:642 length:213 start_codon:yes stop_codon:yes gene_type:complete